MTVYNHGALNPIIIMTGQTSKPLSHDDRQYGGCNGVIKSLKLRRGQLNHLNTKAYYLGDK